MKVYKFKCENCGSEKFVKVDDNTYKCEYCGYKEVVYLENEKQQQNEIASTNSLVNQTNTNSFVMLLICLFLGFMGIHKFMEKKIFMGIIYFFTGGILGIACLVDVCHYFIKWNNERKNGAAK